MASLTSGQRTFAQHLARLTGLNSRAISTWMLAEESGGAAQSRQRQRNNNWLNIGYFDSGPGAITKDQAFRDPVRAAHYTADFLKGRRGGAAPGIRAILRTANQGPEQQLRAIAASPWASSHYGGAGRLVSLLRQAPAPGAASVGGTSTPGRRGSSSGGSPGSPGRAERIRTITETTPGVDNRVGRAALIQSFLDSNSSLDPLDFALQARQLQDVAPTSTTQTIRTPGIPARAATSPSPEGRRTGGGRSSRGSDLASFATQRANALDARHFSYQWGGGHAGKISDIRKAVPVDCSGAVSAVLGIDPRVSGQFTKWGRPGDGGGRGVTIYANGHHVLMKINGHFFGTSASNPGGGAGWIPQGAIGRDYLKGFTVRHSAR